MFSVCNPCPHEMISALHPTYHFETAPPAVRVGLHEPDRLAARLGSMELSQTRVNKKYTAQSASPTLCKPDSSESDHIKVKRTKSKLPGHLLVKSYKRLKGK
jgi:hypothetical protein